jgi:ribose transport system permease protein
MVNNATIDGSATTSIEGGPRKSDRRIPESAALIVFLAAEIIFFTLASPYFFSWDNFVNVLTALSVTGIVAAGATILLIGGQFDLSVGSGIAWVGLMLALLAPVLGLPLAILISVTSGLIIGALNGFLVTVVGVNALITTLGTMAIFRGLTITIGQGQSIPIEGFDWAVIRPFLNIPLPVLLFAGVVLVVGLILHRTVYGRSIYAIGANPTAARLVGIASKRNMFIAFLISGLCMALAGLTSASQLGATSGTTGLGLELAAVTAVILGGTSLAGGVGNIGGTVLGLFIVALLGNGMTLLNVNSSWQQVATGLLLILAVSLDRLRQRAGRAG